MRHLGKIGSRRGGQRGFTIVELLIATAVFSVILLLITEGIIQFNKSYYGGITQTQTQNVARNILENITQAIQFSGGQVHQTPGTNTNKAYYFCVGATRYRYMLGHELSGNPTGTERYHALLSDTPSGACGGAGSGTVSLTSINCPTAGGSCKIANSTELLSASMRLSKLSVTQVGTSNLWTVDVRVAYGADDLLYSPSHPRAANGSVYSDAACHFNWAGAQFCATSELTATVEQRVAD